MLLARLRGRETLQKHEARMSESIWIESSGEKNFPSLRGDIDTDVAIVGGGITGVVAAYLLTRAGRRVVLIDARAPGHGETGHTTAHLTEQVDARFAAVAKQHGKDAARLAARAGRVALEQIAAIAAAEGIDCSLTEVPAFLYTDDAAELDELRQEAEAASEAGVAATFTSEVPLPFAVAGAVRLERQGQFHPLRFLHGVTRAIRAGGGTILEETRAISVDDGSPARVRTDRGTIHAHEVLVTANVPVNQRGILQTKLPAYRSYAIAAPLAAGFEPALFWDNEDPYHYVRTHVEGEETWLIAGGEDHRTGDETDTEKHFAALEAWTRARFTIGAVRFRWSGQIIEPPDGLPYIGRNGFSEHVWVATGYSGQGMTFGAFAGTMLSDLVLGRGSEWKDVFDPMRLPPLESVGTYVAANIEFPLRLASDRLTSRGVEARVLEDVGEGDGKIVKLDGRKIAAARSDGEVHLLSPVCPHLGCDVHWNGAEGSWDCPCHGSRFSPDGRVLNGPASRELRRIDEEEEEGTGGG
jgi:glycine/D-amino acid oxidase-like deaminating enzyme/nitrite reductase/ring-hydroxylating ferredoxin subunit